MDYKNQIIKMISDINQEKYLRYIYVLIRELLGEAV
jgi:hypothetical protein